MSSSSSSHEYRPMSVPAWKRNRSAGNADDDDVHVDFKERDKKPQKKKKFSCGLDVKDNAHLTPTEELEEKIDSLSKMVVEEIGHVDWIVNKMQLYNELELEDLEKVYEDCVGDPTPKSMNKIANLSSKIAQNEILTTELDNHKRLFKKRMNIVKNRIEEKKWEKKIGDFLKRVSFSFSGKDIDLGLFLKDSLMLALTCINRSKMVLLILLLVMVLIFNPLKVSADDDVKIKPTMIIVAKNHDDIRTSLHTLENGGVVNVENSELFDVIYELTGGMYGDRLQLKPGHHSTTRISCTSYPDCIKKCGKHLDVVTDNKLLYNLLLAECPLGTVEFDPGLKFITKKMTGWTPGGKYLIGENVKDEDSLSVMLTQASLLASDRLIYVDMDFKQKLEQMLKLSDVRLGNTRIPIKELTFVIMKPCDINDIDCELIESPLVETLTDKSTSDIVKRLMDLMIDPQGKIKVVAADQDQYDIIKDAVKNNHLEHLVIVEAPSSSFSFGWAEERVLSSKSLFALVYGDGMFLGNAFKLKGFGYLVTAAHVVPDNKAIKLCYGSDSSDCFQTTVVYKDKNLDLAFLESSIVIKDLEVAENIAHISYTMGCHLSFTFLNCDQISANYAGEEKPYKTKSNVNFHKYFGHIPAGRSGSPVVDAMGKVVGFATEGSTSIYRNPSFLIVPIRYIMDRINRRQVAGEWPKDNLVKNGQSVEYKSSSGFVAGALVLADSAMLNGKVMKELTLVFRQAARAVYTLIRKVIDTIRDLLSQFTANRQTIQTISFLYFVLDGGFNNWSGTRIVTAMISLVGSFLSMGPSHVVDAFFKTLGYESIWPSIGLPDFVQIAKDSFNSQMKY